MTSILFLTIALFGCSNKAKTANTTNDNASSYKNNLTSSSPEILPIQSIDSAETSEPVATKPSASESIDPEFTIDDDTSEEETSESEQVAYSKGEFNELHDALIKKYSVGYQSFSKEALIDLYGIGCDEGKLEDAIGFIAQNSYNQLFVFKNCSTENVELFCANILNPIKEDSSIKNIEWKTYSLDSGIDVLCIGDKEFMSDTREMIINSLGGDLSE